MRGRTIGGRSKASRAGVREANAKLGAGPRSASSEPAGGSASAEPVRRHVTDGAIAPANCGAARDQRPIRGLAFASDTRHLDDTSSEASTAPHRNREVDFLTQHQRQFLPNPV